MNSFILRITLTMTVLVNLVACVGTSGRATQLAQSIMKDGPHITLSDEGDRKILQQLIDNMVEIPAGSFEMGDTLDVGESDELPVHTVNVHRFALSRFEVTFEQYDLYARLTDEDAPDDRWGRDQRPVIDVTWHDALDFIEWLRTVTNIPFRLPTEAEWEYAAKAGSSTRYSFGDDRALFCEYANIADASTKTGWRNKACSDGFKTTAPVGSFKANAFGLYDMHGNVWEWLADCWFSDYGSAPADSSLWTSSSCNTRAQRGGSWFYGAEEARSTYRSQGNELDKSVTLGFRLAHDL